MAMWTAECACARALLGRQARAHASLRRLLVLDGSGFRWEGLGNSGVRWMGLLRYGFATGRATFLKISREEDCRRAGHFERHQPSRGRPSDRTCHLDPGEFFTSYGGTSYAGGTSFAEPRVDWWWSEAREAAAARQLRASGEVEHVYQYGCKTRAKGEPGCKLTTLRLPNGSTIELDEPTGLLRFLQRSEERWIRLVLKQQDSLEHSYSHPESLREPHELPLTKCPEAAAPAARSRELVLKCETFGNMLPRPRLMRALLPSLRRLEPFDVVVGAHIRTGYTDWQFRNPEASFARNASSSAAAPTATAAAAASAASAAGDGGDARRWSLIEHWSKLDGFLRDCSNSSGGPCFNWNAPEKKRAPQMADALEICRVDGTGAVRDRESGQVRRADRDRDGSTLAWPNFSLSSGAPDGVLAALLTCAGRIAQTLSAPDGPGGPQQVGVGKWGLLVLSDSPAVPSLAAALPALRGRVVTTDGAGRIGHSSFTKSCSAADGRCDYGRDPGGAWTRSLVDFYLAGSVDGFAKALFTSFIWSTMRRNLLCCKRGAFVQWMAWYDQRRSHRDKPMLDAEFMASLDHAVGGRGLSYLR